jgi:hypothetical protein
MELHEVVHARRRFAGELEQVLRQVRGYAADAGRIVRPSASEKTRA